MRATEAAIHREIPAHIGAQPTGSLRQEFHRCVGRSSPQHQQAKIVGSETRTYRQVRAGQDRGLATGAFTMGVVFPALAAAMLVAYWGTGPCARAELPV